MVIKNKKKSQMAYQELALIVFSILFISLILFVSTMKIIGVKTEVKEFSPEISYKFPAAFVYGYLNWKIDLEDVKKYGFDEDMNYYVLDLLILGTDESIGSAKSYKNDYLEYMKIDDSLGDNVCDYYIKFSGNTCDFDRLIQVTFLKEDSLYKENVFKTLEQEILNHDNYYFYLQTIGGKKLQISFY